MTGPAKWLQTAVALGGYGPQDSWGGGRTPCQSLYFRPSACRSHDSLSLSLLLAATSQAPSPKEPDTGGPSGSLWTGGVSLLLGMKGGRGNGANSSQQHLVSVCTH